MSEPKEIEFDGYHISEFDDNSVWLGWPSGECMQLSNERMKYWLDKIYSEDF